MKIPQRVKDSRTRLLSIAKGQVLTTEDIRHVKAVADFVADNFDDLIERKFSDHLLKIQIKVLRSINEGEEINLYQYDNIEGLVLHGMGHIIDEEGK